MRATKPQTAPALEVRNLQKSFGAIQVANNINLSLPRGARHALIGPNGAGKTTLVNLISGALRASVGDVLLDGEKITTLSQANRTRRGIARDGRFVTSPRNDGLNLLVGTKFVKNADGQPILLTWDHLQQMGGTKESRAAEVARAQETGGVQP